MMLTRKNGIDIMEAGGGIMKINIHVSDEVWEKVGVLALALKKSKGQIVEDALREYVEKHRGRIKEFSMYIVGGEE